LTKTSIGLEVPEIEAVTVSVAVMLWLPVVGSLAEKVPVPSVSVESAGSAAWVSLRLFVEINDWTWDPTPSIDDAEATVLAVAAGNWDEGTTSTWLRRHLQPLSAND
jgi:hypothetical protein